MIIEIIGKFYDNQSLTIINREMAIGLSKLHDVYITPLDQIDAEAKVKGKVWVTGQAEPNEWSIEVVDPLANETGSPGIYGYSSAEIHYDNLEIKASKGGE